MTYVMDALRQKEGAFAAVWVTLGAVNLTLLLTGAAFTHGRPILLGICLTVANGATLLLTGEIYNVIYMPTAATNHAHHMQATKPRILKATVDDPHTGVWATLQFKWLQLQYPPVTLALERVLLAAALPIGAAMQVHPAEAFLHPLHCVNQGCSCTLLQAHM